MQYQIIHTTEYDYHQSVSLCHNIARLIPRDTGMQHCKKTVIKITPQPSVMNEYEDFFGNKVVYFAIQQEHAHLKVTVHSTVEKKLDINPKLNLYPHTSWEETKLELLKPNEDNFDARQYIPATDITTAIPEITAYALQSFTPGSVFYEAVQDLMHRIYKDFKFTSGLTTISTPLADVMKHRKGVCQDFAHLAIACIRSLGLPARYVSGYLETLAPEGKEKLTGVDASHAWFAVYLPNHGWLDFDPTNNMVPSDQHITIGWGRDYTDIAPLKGVILSSGQHKLKVAVDVRKVG